MSVTTEAPSVQKRKPPYKLVSLLIGAVGLVFLGYQLGMNRESNDRTAGRIGTRFDVVRLEPAFESPECKKRLRFVEQFGSSDFVHFSDVGDYAAFHPRILVKNSGDEVIESLRVEVQEITLIPLVQGRPAAITPSFTPHTEPSKREEYILSERLNPGDFAMVPIYRPLLQSLLHAQGAKDNYIVEAISKGKKMGFYAQFEIRCFAKGFGTTGFDRPANGPSTSTGFIWNPDGFSEEACKRYLELAPTVRIGRDERVALPKVRDLEVTR